MHSLVWKLSIAFVLVSLVGIILISVTTSNLVKAGSGTFELSYFAQQMGEYYQEYGEWPVARGEKNGRNRFGPPNIRWEVINSNGDVVASNHDNFKRPGDSAEFLPIVIEGEQIAKLAIFFPPGMTREQQAIGRARDQFIRETGRSLIRNALIAVLLSIIVGGVVARSLIQPLQALTRAARAIAQGDLNQTVQIESQDELGELGYAFNQMSADLHREQHARHQMSADIAHELRTPVSIIMGHCEAVKDGVLPADLVSFNIVHDESIRLNRLISELHTLTLAEAGELRLNRRPIEVIALLERVKQVYYPQAASQGVVLGVSAESKLPTFHADPDRMAQLLDNLVSNALRYTPEGGKIELTAQMVGKVLEIRVKDSGSGIAPDALPHIFERFYQVDRSRQRMGGGSGLGLAIVQSLVKQHGGMISAESQLGQGTVFIMRFPLAVDPQSPKLNSADLTANLPERGSIAS